MQEQGTRVGQNTPGFTNWKMQGELALSCNCDLFCPCVVSLGAAKPTHGYCQAWLAIRIDEGHAGDISLSGLNLAAMMDIPGRMGEGGWTMAMYADDRADGAQADAMEAIMCGQAGGPPGVLSLLVANYLGKKAVPVTYETDGDSRKIGAGKHVRGSVHPMMGAEPGEATTIENSAYWISSQIIVATSEKGRVRDFGRVWNFDNQSAELCPIDWNVG